MSSRHNATPIPPWPTDGRDCVHTRLIDATPVRIYAAFADPAQLSRWWGPAGFRNSFEVFEFRPGGAWRFVMHGPDGADYRNTSVFLDLQPGQRVLIEHLAEVHHFLLDVSLQAQGEATLLRWCQRFDSAEHREQVAAMVLPANEQNLDRLSTLLRGADPS